MPSFNELKKMIQKAGCRYFRDGEGSAEIWVNANGEKFSIHFHGQKEVGKGMVLKIKKWAGLK